MLHISLLSLSPCSLFLFITVTMYGSLSFWGSNTISLMDSVRFSLLLPPVFQSSGDAVLLLLLLHSNCLCLRNDGRLCRDSSSLSPRCAFPILLFFNCFNPFDSHQPKGGLRPFLCVHVYYEFTSLGFSSGFIHPIQQPWTLD